MSFKPSLALLLTAALAAGCTEKERPQPTLLTTSNAITNGTADNTPSHTAVVALADASREFFCSGTLISRRVVLTAAHCAELCTPGTCYIGFGQDVSSPSMTWIPISEVSVHPDWDSNNLINDIGLLRLASASPASITPIPALPAALALDQTAVGLTVEFSGFGQTETGAYGTKLKVSDTLDCICETPGGCSCLNEHVSPWTICYDQQPGGPCSGDSGGPAFVTIDGQEYVAGITSYGDYWCNYFGCSTKADHFDEYIQAFIGVVGSNPDGTACTAGSECESGFCADGVCCNARCDQDGCDACSVAAGGTTDGVCAAVAGTCDDGNLCTQNDHCVSGTCRGSTLTCPAPDSCHKPSTCNAQTGTCFDFEAKPDGTVCNDSNECTVSDSCQAGQCVGTERTTCASRNPCKEDALCVDGACGDYPNKPEGTECDDGNPCTVGDACRSGTCRSGATMECPALDACHFPSTCDRGTGQCRPSQPRPEGGDCDDGNSCTSGEKCASGVCTGGAVTGTTCEAPDDCHAGRCDAQTGECILDPVADGTTCDDGDACTSGDKCQAGSCVGTQSACTAPNACKISQGCDAQSGQCVFTDAPTGTGCDDSNPCTTGDVCVDGSCAGVAVTCPASECRAAGSCDPAAGGCVNAPLADGTACSGGKCAAGECVKEPPQEEASGCGCTTTAAGPAPLLLALFALIAPRRRARK